MLALAGTAQSAAAQRTRITATLDTLAPTVAVEPWGMAEGLPQSSVLQLTTDRRGYVWGITFSGQFRFDGQSITSLPSIPLPHLDGQTVTAQAARADGALLVGTNRGRMAILASGTAADSFPTPPFAPGSMIEDLHVDKFGVVWVRSGTDVATYGQGQWARQAIPNRGDARFAENAQGEVVYVGWRGLVRGRPGALREDPRIGVIRSTGERIGLYADALGRLWVGGEALRIIDGEVIRTVPGVRGIVTSITADAAGQLWVGTDRGLYRIPRETAPTATMRAELMLGLRDAVLSVARTADDLVVVGTRGGGMMILRENPVRIMPHGRTADRQVTTVVADREGGVWAAGGCTDLHRFDENGRATDSVTRAPYGGCIRGAAHDEQGRLWVAMDGWVRRRDRQGVLRDWAVRTLGTNPPVPRPMLRVGAAMLVGLSDGRIARIGPDDELQMDPAWATPTRLAIESLALDANGTIWVGQIGIVTAWRGQTLTRYGRDAKVPAAVPRALLPDSNGVWIGTYGSGLVFLDTRSSPARARRLPLRDQAVSGFARDRSGRLWMPGNRGLTVVSYDAMRRWVADSLTRPDFLLLGMSDGVPEGNYGQPAIVALQGNEIVSGSIEGLVRTTADITHLGQTPAPLIEQVRTSRQTRAIDASPMHLGTSERHFTVLFSMPTFRFADEAQFRYRLDGRDGEWIPIDEVRQVQLSGLGAGRHALEVEGRIPGGDWRAATPFRFDVAPFWHERWSIRLLVLLAMVGSGVLIARQRWRAVRAELRAREVELQARRDVAEQAERHQRELAQVGRVAVAGELTASLSHELGQPLAAIVNNAEVARRLAERLPVPDGVQAQEIDEVLRDVVIQGRRASQVVREFRRFLRREPAAATSLAIGELVDSVVVLMRQEFAQADVALEVHRPASLPLLFGERVLIQQVLVNLLQNALEAVRAEASAPGKVLLRVRATRDGVRFSVVDTGPGFAPTVRPMALEPFVTGRDHGMGMGLAIARRIVESHGGHIGIGRLASAGAVVSVWFPLVAVFEAGDRLVPAQVTPVPAAPVPAAPVLATPVPAASPAPRFASDGLPHEISA